MPTIQAGSGIVTQINVFSVAPENVDPLIELLTQAAQSVRDVPGWISASLHVSQERDRVVNYAQCRDMESWHRIMAKLREGGFLDQNKTLGTPSPGLYEVVWSLETND